MPDILILGASSDIAAATAFEFAANGYTTGLQQEIQNFFRCRPMILI